MKRLAALLVLSAAVFSAPPAPVPHEYVQAVEFPYYLCPRTLWERELVWLKNIGVDTVEFSIPWNWHQLQPGEYDFTGRTSPRRDLVAFIRTLRKLDLHAWVRPLPPVEGFRDNGAPPSADARAQRAWLHALERLLTTQTAAHGGPIAYVEGRVLSIDAAAPPAPLATISAADPDSLARSRDALAANAPSAVLWTHVEDALYPAGWAADPATLLRPGAVGLSGDERPTAVPLRRNAALLRKWGPRRSELHSVPIPKPAAGKFPDGVTASELTSPGVSAVSLTNRGKAPFHDELRVFEPISRRTLVIPEITVPSGESLWLPLDVSLGPVGLCHECTQFAEAERIVYATAELLTIEFENGILAMEFAAPVGGEMILQLARKPVGPYLALGKPTEFDWDDKTLRARFAIPANPGPGNRVRVGIAMEEPETSAFFNEAHRLIIGQKNVVSTAYSSAEVATRSRMLLPSGFTAVPIPKSPNEIDYEIGTPPEALHGEYADLALEADGVPLGRAHLQMFRPVSIRLMQAIQLHFGTEAELAPDPPIAPIEPKAGSDLELSIRNNWPGIQDYTLTASGDGLDFFPAKADIAVGAVAERLARLRIFAKEGVEGLRDWNLKVGGGAAQDLPMRVVLVPRGRTVAWSADLDGDGSPEWVLETQKVRAIFSSQDGGRWMELNWKDTNLNFLPPQGVFAAQSPVDVHAVGDSLEFLGSGWKRTVRLTGMVLSVEQTTPLPDDHLASDRRGNVSFSVEHPAANRATYTLK
ncbi:MAG TPA: beta-galactosidase [Bryobacteraceae bacterium]|nr:beta-galactosidase [Bryobacteraceae bacterium]